MKPIKRSNLIISVTQYCNLILTLAFVVMWALSYHFYTSVGIDADQAAGNLVLSSYYRVCWPGDGSFWLGGEADYRPLSAGPVEQFDLGGAVFERPRHKPVPRSLWNRIGFWWFKNSFRILKNHQPAWIFWIGVPSWLPMLLTGLWPLRWWRQSRRLAARIA